MSETISPSSPSSPNGPNGTPFGAMTIGGKFVWILRFIVALCTFGFVFPNVMNE